MDYMTLHSKYNSLTEHFILCVTSLSKGASYRNLSDKIILSEPRWLRGLKMAGDDLCSSGSNPSTTYMTE